VKNGYWRGRNLELMQKLNIPLAANVFTLDIGKIREKCLELGNVEEASVQLVLPDMLVFEFKERVPRAVIDGDMFIDEKGVKFKKEESTEATYVLPEIVGDSSNQFVVSKAVELILVATRECRDITVKRVDISNPNELRVILVSDLLGRERDLEVLFPVNRNFSELFNELQNVIFFVHQQSDFDGHINLLHGHAVYGTKK
jgi:cell division septal protein FtsQ